MGEINKTITVEVPVNVVYEAIKESYLSEWREKYCKDLMKRDIVVLSISKDVPNSELTITGGRWGAKVEITYKFLSIGESVCEVTCNCKYRLILDASARDEMISIIGSLLMLEQGYKAKK